MTVTRFMKSIEKLPHFALIVSLLSLSPLSAEQKVSESQEKWVEHYKKQASVPDPAKMLINTEEEPDLAGDGFVSLYNGKNLDGWVRLQGAQDFEARGDVIVGTCVRGSKSSYLSTEKSDYRDFVLTAEFFWEVDMNTGMIFRGQSRKGKKPGNEFITVFGPQVEMEQESNDRRWSGGIYEQSAGGWAYPLWLEAHEEVRNAVKYDEWNRITVKAVGKDIKTWVNGLPAAHWKTEKYPEGFISLQVHSGGKGEVHFKKIKVKELKDAKEQAWENLFESGDFAKWEKPSGKLVAEPWTIKEGVVHRGGLKPGGIVTKKFYKDFELKFEWKISQAGNSGVKYRTKETKKNLGLEYQIIDDDKAKGAKEPSHRAGSIYDILAARDSKSLKPVGEWNSGRIVAKGNDLEHWLNGEKVAEIEYGSDDWNERFQMSKYKEHEGFGNWTGPILLQDHGNQVWFREVYVREL